MSCKVIPCFWILISLNLSQDSSLAHEPPCPFNVWHQRNCVQWPFGKYTWLFVPANSHNWGDLSKFDPFFWLFDKVHTLLDAYQKTGCKFWISDIWISGLRRREAAAGLAKWPWYQFVRKAEGGAQEVISPDVHVQTILFKSHHELKIHSVSVLSPISDHKFVFEI